GGRAAWKFLAFLSRDQFQVILPERASGNMDPGLRRLYSKGELMANVLRCGKYLKNREKFLRTQFLTGTGPYTIFRPICAAGPFSMSCGEPAGMSRRFARARTDPSDPGWLPSERSE